MVGRTGRLIGERIAAGKMPLPDAIIGATAALTSSEWLLTVDRRLARTLAPLLRATRVIDVYEWTSETDRSS